MFKYLVANDRDVSWGLYVDTIGYEEIKPGEHYPTQGHADGESSTNTSCNILKKVVEPSALRTNPKPICARATFFYCSLANGIPTALTLKRAGSAIG